MTVSGTVWLATDASTIKPYIKNAVGQLQTDKRTNMGQQDIAAKAIQDFVDSMIGARESGFEETSNLTLADVYAYSRFYIQLHYGVESPALSEKWGSDVAELCKKTGDTELNAARYLWLRERGLDTISQGGVFAGQTPENVVLNGEDLDQAIDSAMNADTGNAAE